MRYIFLISIFVFSSACTQQYVVMPEGIDRYTAALVQVTSEISDTEWETKKLASMVVDALNNRHLYQQVSQEQRQSQAKTLLIKLVIVHINRTSNVERIAEGRMARSNEVTAVVSLMNNTTGELLSSFRLKGISPERIGISVDWPWGSVEKALLQISQQLARQLAEW